MSQVTKEIINQNKKNVSDYSFLYEFKFRIKFTDRNTYINNHKNHIIKVSDKTIITHADFKTMTYDLEDILLVEANDFTTMKLLVHDLIEKNFNKKKFEFKFHLMSNKPKLESCKYVFVLKDFANRKLDEIRKKQ